MSDDARHKSKVDEYGFVYVPDDLREQLGIEKNTLLHWTVEDGRLVAVKTDPITFENIHRALFPDGPPKRRTLEDLNAARGRVAAKKHARR